MFVFANCHLLLGRFQLFLGCRHLFWLHSTRCLFHLMLPSVCMPWFSLLELWEVRLWSMGLLIEIKFISKANPSSFCYTVHMTPIEPRNLKGFRDFLPPQQIIRQKMMDSIRASYESFGFEPLETPALEYADILTGKYGDEGDKLMYRFKDNGDRDVALRYDLSIPLARVVAQYDNDIKKPWKRYQMSPVWRAENTQKGRFREFYQCDADIVGSTSPLADAEVLALASQTLQKLDIETKDFIIRVNGRGIIRDFYTKLGLSESEQISAMRAVDKVAKIGRDGVEKELAVHGFSADNIQSIVSFADTRITDITNTTLIEENFPEIQDSLGELINIVRYALKLAPNTNIVIDFSIARGLDYYTGMIFETYLLKATQFGSILSGGRFDELVGTFAKKSIPAVGLSVGLDRFISALEESDLITKTKNHH